MSFPTRRFSLPAFLKFILAKESVIEVGLFKEAYNYDSFVYKESELKLYLLAHSIFDNIDPGKEAGKIAGIDFIGGDISSKSYSSGDDQNNYDACKSACAEDTQCEGFTLALVNHDIENKKEKCWLKNEKATPRLDQRYWSHVKEK